MRQHADDEPDSVAVDPPRARTARACPADRRDIRERRAPSVGSVGGHEAVSAPHAVSVR
jgi:hypothetical protein